MTSMTVSVPSARLLGDVAALLTPVEASNVELFEWTLESPSNREHIDIVDRVKGTPAASAARAAWISPSGYCIPSSPTGASATGIVTG